MVTAGTNITVATVNGLRKGTEYRFHVVADNGFFKAKDSNIITVTTNTSRKLVDILHKPLATRTML